jgi:protein-disulfide isomerase
VQNKTRSYISYSLGTAFVAAVAFAAISACNSEQAKAKPNIVYKETSKPGVVAKIGNDEITEDQLMGDDKLDFFDLKKREYELKMNQLNKLMVDKLIGAEARKENMSVDDFVNKKVVKGDLKVSDKEYNKFVADKKIPESQLNPQIKERIISYMQGTKRQELIQDYIGKLTKTSPIEVYFSRPKMQVNVDAGTGPFTGGEKAGVTIVEFSDFQCPFCARAAETVGELKKKYGNKVKIVFRHFPLPMHKDAQPASEASMCVNEQGSAKFWKFHDLAFKSQDKLDGDNLAKLAKESGADEKKFKECMDSKKFAEIVKSDMAYGEKIGVKSTPTFFVNGQLLSGALPVESFSEIIDEELTVAKN